MKTRYVVELTDEQRTHLYELTRKGKASARVTRRAHTLLLADKGESDAMISAALSISEATVHRTRERFVKEGLQSSLSERTRPGGRPKLTGRQEVYLVALACSKAPEGRKCWTLDLLSSRMVELGIVGSISRDTVRRTLKKTK